MSDQNYEVKIQNGQAVVFFGGDHSGVALRINKGARTIGVDGWYDGSVGIQGGEIDLDDLLHLFKPTKRNPHPLAGVREA